MYCMVDSQGNIKAAFAQQQDATQPAYAGLTQQEIADTDPKVLAFINPAANVLTAAQDAAYTAIDSQAGLTRLKYITSVPGQADTYTRKANDAANYKAAGYPFASLSSYVYVQAEAFAMYGTAATAAQAQAAADGILSTLSAWDAKGAAIEQQRRAGKLAVQAATTVAAVQSAEAAAIAALQAL